MTYDIQRFRAPWGKLLSGITLVSTGLLGFATFAIWSTSPLLGLVFAGTLAICAAGAVRGYRIDGDTLVIERLGFDKRVSLKGLTAARHDKDLIQGSLRVGNGGLFVFSGYYWSKKLGWFRLHGNDILGRAVLLEIDGKKWMITPEYPNTFVEEISKHIER